MQQNVILHLCPHGVNIPAVRANQIAVTLHCSFPTLVSMNGSLIHYVITTWAITHMCYTQMWM